MEWNQIKQPSLYKRVLREGVRCNPDNGNSVTAKEEIESRIYSYQCIDVSQITEPLMEDNRLKEKGERRLSVKDIQSIFNQWDLAMPFSEVFLNLGIEYWRDSEGNHGKAGELIPAQVGCFLDLSEDGFIHVIFVLGFNSSPPFLFGQNVFEYKNKKLTFLRGISGDDFCDGLALQYSFYVAQSLSWLAAKNIELQEHIWPEKQQRQMGKVCGKRAYKHYTLTVKLPGKKTGGDSSPEYKGVMPLHLVRGHLKRYTAEKPLFGKYIGTFYVPAHTRGETENGVIDKDYRVVTETGVPVKEQRQGQKGLFEVSNG